jgi:hypothetical protein
MTNRSRSLFAASLAAAPAATSGVASPCVSVCRMDPSSGLCEGCLRTIDEIAQWSTYSDADKRVVLAQIEARKAANTP